LRAVFHPAGSADKFLVFAALAYNKSLFGVCLEWNISLSKAFYGFSLGKEGIIMDIVSLLVQLVSGAVGGNVAGGLLRKMSLGVLGNSLAGIVGGGIGGQILNSVLGVGGAAGGSIMDAGIGAIISQIAGGGVGGGVVMVIVGLLRRMFAK